MTTSAATYTGSCGDSGYDLAYTLDTDTGILTISGNGYMRHYSYGEAPWNSIRSSIKTVIIEDGVKSIGKCAFYYCASIISIDIPESVTSIGVRSFDHCSSLTEVSIPSKVTSIGDYAFYYCKSLTNITIPESVTSIGSSSFSNCGARIIKCYKDSYAETYAKKYGFTVEYIEEAFEGSCGENAEYVFDKDTGTLTISGTGQMNYYYPENTIPWSRYLSDIKQVVITEGIENICSYAFQGCENLTSVVIANGVTSIDRNAFDECTKLTSINIPDSVNNIGYYAFRNCSSLTSITIPQGINTIKDRTFYGCASLKEISIPDSVTTLEYGAFYNCSGIASIYIPESVTTIGERAFFYCTGLTNIIIPDSVINIGEDAFYTQSSLLILCNEDSYVATYAKNNNIAAHYYQHTATKTSTTATCLTDGVAQYLCNECTYTYSKAEAALGHDYINREAQAATCTNIGWNAYQSCSRCDYTTYTGDIPALGHDNINHEAKDATCTEIGWDAYQTCSRCDYTSYVEIAALDHDYIYHNAQTASCTEIGWDVYQTCSRCYYTTYAGDIPAIGHDYINHEAKDATCTEIGWDVYQACSRCDYTTYTGDIPALGHDYINHEAKDATCTEIGWDTYQTCSRCDYTSYVEIAARGHNLDSTILIPVTCFQNGETKHVCASCGFEYTEEIITSGHSYTWNLHSTSEHIGNCQNCDSSILDEHNIQSKKCLICNAAVDSCGESLTYYWDQISGKLIITGTGNMKSYEYYLGSYYWAPWTYNNGNILKTVIVEEGVTSISDDAFRNCHNLEKVVVSSSVTTIDPGAFYNCKKLTSFTIYAMRTDFDYALTPNGREDVFELHSANLVIYCYEGSDADIYAQEMGITVEYIHDHDYIAIDTVPASCTQEGSITYECSICGKKRVEYLPMVAHTYGIDTIFESPTCTEEGYGKMICSACGMTQYADIPALGHLHTASVVYEAPTCTKIGAGKYVCQNCEDSYNGELPALGHDYIKHEAKAATCTEIGYAEYESCSRCDYTTYSGDIPALGHSMEETIMIPPTASTAGQLQRKCAVCGHTEYEEIPMLEAVQGDFDGDGVVGVKDVITSLDALLNNKVLEDADMNGDGKLTLIDILLVLKSITA